MPNDVPMLLRAGLGVAMGNAHPDAVAAADEVTTPNTDDGLARVLERWWSDRRESSTARRSVRRLGLSG